MAIPTWEAPGVANRAVRPVAEGDGYANWITLLQPPRSSMTEAQNSDELLETQKEIRHLKETVIALREEMEVLGVERDEAYQRAVEESQTEIRQLQATISALRDELENVQAKAAEDWAEAERALRGDIDHLQDMITVLREKLELASMADA